MSDPETLGWACQTCGRDSMFCACNPETSTDPPAALTGTDAGVAALVERLQVKITGIRSLMATANALDDTSIYLGHATQLEECAAALAQQATQLQEARAEALDWQLAADGIKHHFNCANNVVTGDPRGSICDRCRAEAAEKSLAEAEWDRTRAWTLWAELNNEATDLRTALAEARRALDEATGKQVSSHD